METVKYIVSIINILLAAMFFMFAMSKKENGSNKLFFLVLGINQMALVLMVWK